MCRRFHSAQCMRQENADMNTIRYLLRKGTEQTRHFFAAFVVVMTGVALADETAEIGGFEWTYKTAFEEVQITGVSPKSGRPVIPPEISGNPVTSIGTNVFAGGTITSVEIPESVMRIGDSAFQHCSNLTSVTFAELRFDDGLEEIGQYAFYGCSSLKSMEFPENLKKIGLRAFQYCDNLQGVVLHKEVADVGSWAFANCSNLRDISVEKGNVKYIDIDGVLFTADMKNLVSYPAGKTDRFYTFPVGVTGLQAGAFAGCALEGVVFNSRIADTGSQAFYKCENLKEVVFGESMKSLGTYAFYYTAMEQVTVPPKVVSVRNGTFRSSSIFGKILVHNSCTNIHDKAFTNGDDTYPTVYSYSDDQAVQVKFALCDAGDDISYTRVVVKGDEVGLLPAPTFSGKFLLGWYTQRAEDGGERILSNEVILSGSSVTYYAHWIDALVAGIPAEPIDTGLVGYTVKGLPSGLKYDKNSGMISGTAKTVTPASGTVAWFTKKGSPDVPIAFVVRAENVTASCAGLSGGNITVGVNGGVDGIPVDVSAETDVRSVSVKGLPSGMKYDAKSGKIVGTPTKSGAFTATVTVTTKAGTKMTKEFAFTVKAVNPRAVGTFKGYVCTTTTAVPIDALPYMGTVQFTSTDTGKLSAKVVTAQGAYSFSATGWDAVTNKKYYVSFTTKKGAAFALELDAGVALNKYMLYGEFTPDDGTPTRPVVAFGNIFARDWYFKVDADHDIDSTYVYDLKRTYDAKSADLTVTLKGDGTAAIKGNVRQFKVSASGFANLLLAEHGILAVFVPTVSFRDIGNVVKKFPLAIQTIIQYDDNEGDVAGGVRVVVE